MLFNHLNLLLQTKNTRASFNKVSLQNASLWLLLLVLCRASDINVNGLLL